MKKRIFSIFLVLVLCFCICFQCSLNSYALFGVDDVLLCGIVLDLVACGITIYSVSEFVQSDTFKDFCDSVGNNIAQQISIVKIHGQLFYNTTKLGWLMIQNWVKSHFSGKTETKTIQFDTWTASPEFLILNNGVTVPYDPFMEYPFFVFKSHNSDVYYAYYVNNQESGIIPHYYDVQFYCVGTGRIYCMKLNNGSWEQYSTKSMLTGVTYKGQSGSANTVSITTTNGCNKDEWYLYRTIDIVMNNEGVINPNFSNPQTLPNGTGTATITAHSDASRFPGAIDSVAENIKDGESILIKVPDDIVIDEGNGDLTVSTNPSVVGDAIADTTVADVAPRVLTETVSEGVDTVVGDVITDTPAQEIPTENVQGNAADDIETANKFKLPKSFLEGFPFSIPYSVFVGIKSFVAEGEAPVFNIPFNIQRLGISEVVSIDLSSWSPVARLCRALLSFVWVAGLAMACGKFIKR